MLIYNGTTLISAVPENTENTVSLSVPPGSYTVMVIAGTGPESGALFLGSGYQENVSVTEDSTTEVYLTLATRGP